MVFGLGGGRGERKVFNQLFLLSFGSIFPFSMWLGIYLLKNFYSLMSLFGERGDEEGGITMVVV